MSVSEGRLAALILLYIDLSRSIPENNQTEYIDRLERLLGRIEILAQSIAEDHRAI